MTKTEEVSPEILARVKREIETMLNLFGEALYPASESTASWKRLEECLRHYQEMEALYQNHKTSVSK